MSHSYLDKLCKFSNAPSFTKECAFEAFGKAECGKHIHGFENGKFTRFCFVYLPLQIPDTGGLKFNTVQSVYT